MKVELRLARWHQLSRNVVGGEHGVGEARAFQNFFVHALIAGPVAGVAAGYVDHNLTGSDAGGRVKLQGSVLQFEAAMHCVKDVAESERDRGSGRIELDRVLRGSERKAAEYEA